MHVFHNYIYDHTNRYILINNYILILYIFNFNNFIINKLIYLINYCIINLQFVF